MILGLLNNKTIWDDFQQAHSSIWQMVQSHMCLHNCQKTPFQSAQKSKVLETVRLYTGKARRKEIEISSKDTAIYIKAFKTFFSV